MSAIQDANASAGQSTSQAPDFDYAAALSNYQTQDGQVPLTQQQRNDVLSQIVSNTSAQNTNNALTNPNPPEMARLLDDLAHYQATQQQLEMLQKLSDQQNHKIQNIHERILPLSPTGQIEGIGAGGNGQDGYFDANGLGEPGNYDLNIDNFVHDDDFFTDNGNRTGAGDASVENPGLPDFNFDTGGFGEGDGGAGAEAFTFPGEEMVDAVGKVDLSGGGEAGDALDTDKLAVGNEDVAKVESLSSNSTSPAATVEEVEDETRRRSPKRRRK